MDATGVPIWYIFNESDMCSPDQPERVLIKTADMRNMIAYVPDRKSKRANVPRESHVALGHYECGACGTIVGAYDRYCRMCRAELEDE